MNSHIRLIEKGPKAEGVLTVWTDKRLSKIEIDALARWLNDEGYIEVETRVRIYQCFGEKSGPVTSIRPLLWPLAAIVLFLWPVSLAICYYIFSVS